MILRFGMISLRKKVAQYALDHGVETKFTGIVPAQGRPSGTAATLQKIVDEAIRPALERMAKEIEKAADKVKDPDAAASARACADGLRDLGAAFLRKLPWRGWQIRAYLERNGLEVASETSGESEETAVF